MNALNVVKFAAKVAVGAGTGKVTHAIIKNNVQPENIQDTVAVASASFVIASMAAEATKQYTDTQIDNIAQAITNVRDHFKNKETAPETETEEV